MVLYPVSFTTGYLYPHSPDSVTQSKTTILDHEYRGDKFLPGIPSDTTISISPSGVNRQKASILTRQVSFEVNGDLDELVIKVVDKKSGEVVRQIPSETLIQLAESIQKHQRDFFNLG